MGLTDFFKSKTKTMDVRSPQKAAADQWLLDLLQSDAPEFPAEKIAGLSANEQLAMSQAEQYGTSEAEGLDALRDIVGQSEDITDDPSIKGLLSVLDERGSREANRLSRGLTLRGVTGGAGRDALGRGLQDIQNNILATLAPYAESSKNRRVSAAQILNQLGEGSTLNRLNALSSTGAVSRQIEQLQNSAEYQRVMQQLLFPYTHGLNVTGAISNMPQAVVQTPSMFQQIAAPVAQIAQAAGSFKSAFGNNKKET
jgi:hypothetical protein